MSDRNGSNGRNGQGTRGFPEIATRSPEAVGGDGAPGERDLQLVCAIGPYELDVLARPVTGKDLEIVGQVTRADRIHEPVSGISVVLFDADHLVPVDRTHTDEMGEFCLSGQPPTRYFVALGDAPDAPSMLIWEGT